MFLAELLGLEEVEVEPGDFGVVFKKNGSGFGFGDPETRLDMVDLYEKSPVAMMMLVSVLLGDTPTAKLCREQLADELVNQMDNENELPN